MNEEAGESPVAEPNEGEAVVYTVRPVATALVGFRSNTAAHFSIAVNMNGQVVIASVNTQSLANYHYISECMAAVNAAIARGVDIRITALFGATHVNSVVNYPNGKLFIRELEVLGMRFSSSTFQ